MKLKQFFAIVFLFSVVPASAQDYCMTTAAGYGRDATGGAGGTVKTVKTVSELRSALTAQGSAIIIVTESITFGASDMINAAISNKTLLGLKGVKLIQNNDGGILGLNTGSSNVIIRNLIFEGPGAYDVDGSDLLSNKGCNNLWVDHCEFYDGLDGNFDNTNSSDNISISWCTFGYNKAARSGGSGGSSDHRFSNLVGSSASDAPSDGRRSITFHYCYWTSGCKSRMPRARNADLHLLNCFNDSPDASPAIGLGGGSKGLDCYVEGCVFENIKSLYSSYNSSDGGTHTLTYVDCSSSKSMSNVGTAPKPDYSYTALPKENVKAAITSGCGAGATLDITLSGVITSPYPTDNPPEALSVPQNVTATAGATSIQITWDAVAGATGYKIKLSYENTPDPGNPEPRVREWDFSSAWTIDADDADNNLVLHSDGIRFNYGPATNDEELKFENGTVIPDLAGLRFTAGATDKLRLGFGTGLIYLNGKSIQVGIPCNTGDRITVEGLSSNATATDRGFSASGATVDETGTSANITDGILTEAGANAVWAYTATANLVELTTVTGGMNISKITVTLQGGTSGSSETVTGEYTVEGGNVTGKTFDGLTPNTGYTYQVKALRNAEESAYSEAATINTTVTALQRPGPEEWQCLQTGDEFVVNGPEVTEISLYDLSGKMLMGVSASRRINVSTLNRGLYILSIKTNDGSIYTSKIVRR
jgi:pectate lyase